MKMDGLHSALHVGKVELKFTKVDGTERIMVCTLYDKMIPAMPTESVKRERRAPESVTAVWDLENKDWRSFKNDNVISWRLV
jgi:hypothetical protein